MRRPRPSPRAIMEAEEAMLWLRWLEPETRQARLGPGLPHRVEADLLAHRHFAPARLSSLEYGHSAIFRRLNGRRVPTKRSPRYVVEEAPERLIIFAPKARYSGFEALRRTSGHDQISCPQ